MAKIGIFYGSTSGHTANAAALIAELLTGAAHEVTVKNMESSDLDELLGYDNLLIGCSTWGHGDLQNDWRDPYDEMDEADFHGKVFAFFGTGDSSKHAESFANALGLLYDKIVARGGSVIGSVPAEDYRYESSLAVKAGRFVGLALDEVNEAHKSRTRIEAWVKAIGLSFR